MSSTRRSVAVAFASALVAAGCTAFTADRPTGDTQDASVGDAAVSDAGVVDASATDAGVVDSSSPRGPFCSGAGPVTFCDEFDRLDPLGGGWTRQNVVSGSSLAILAEGGRGSLQATIPMAPGDGYARLEKVVAITPKRVSLELELRIDAYPAAPIQAMGLYFGNVAALTLLLNPGTDAGASKASIVEQSFGAGAASVYHDLSVSPVPGSPQRLRLTADLGLQKVELFLNDASVLAEPLGLIDRKSVV